MRHVCFGEKNNLVLPIIYDTKLDTYVNIYVSEIPSILLNRM